MTDDNRVQSFDASTDYAELLKRLLGEALAGLDLLTSKPKPSEVPAPASSGGGLSTARSTRSE